MPAPGCWQMTWSSSRTPLRRTSPTSRRSRRGAPSSKPSLRRAAGGRRHWSSSPRRRRPQLNAARDTWYQLSAGRERLRSLASLAQERCRLLGSADPAPEPGRDPDQLERQAARVRGEQADLEQDILAGRAALEAATAAKSAAEDAAAAEEKRLTAALRAAADRREGLARLAGQVGAARSKVESAQAEVGRLRESLAAGDERRRHAQSEFTALESQVAGVEDGEETLDAEYEDASAALDGILAEIDSLKSAERDAVRERDALKARHDALQLGLNRKDGSEHVLGAGVAGTVGPLATALTVEPGYEAAVAAALGSASDAIVVRDAGTAAELVRLLREDDAGRATLLLEAAAPPAGAPAAAGKTAAGSGALPAGARPAADLVTASGTTAAAVRTLLAATAVVDDHETAADLVAGRPDLTAVTLAGDVFTAWTVTGGSAKAPSLLEVQAAVDDAASRLTAVTAGLEQGRFALAAAEARRAEAQERADAALERLHESDARLAAVAERLGHLNSVLRSAVGESERLAASLARAEANIVAEQEALTAVAARLAAAQDAPAEEEPSTEQRDALALAASQARSAEMEARLSLRSREEQLTAISNRAASLERAAASERRAREQAAERARRRRIQAKRAAAVSAAAEQLIRFSDVSVELAGRERDLAEQVREQRDRELADIRTANDALARELAELTDSVHRDELARAQQRLRIEALETKSVEELGLTADQLVADYGPDQPVPVPAAASTDKWAALRAPVDD